MENILVAAKLNNLRMSPRKVSLVASAVSRMSLPDAISTLEFAEKRAARYLFKLFNSAVSNAKSRGISEDSLKIKEILVGPGRTLKRGRFVSKGSYHKIMKRTSNVTLWLEGFKKEAKKDGK